MKANLHIHSTFSDGTKTIKEIDELVKKNFDVVAITDHDTVNAISEIKLLSSPVKYIIGVEMSVSYEKEIIHILGYFGNNVNNEVIEYFKNEEEKLRNRCLLMIDNLKKYYQIDISYENVKKRADGIINSSHVAMEICDKYGYDFQEVYDKFLGHDKKAYVPNDCISLEDAINYLHQNNALVVLAHPILIHKFDFNKILDMGFDGIEVYHPNQDINYQNMLLKIAKEHNLIVTGGSDYHGDILEFAIDEAYIEGDNVNIFLNKLKERELTNVRK